MRRNILFAFVLLLGLSGQVRAQEARNGTSAANQLMIPVDAQYLGGAGAAANASGIVSVLWNPAGLDRATGDVSAMFSRREYIADIGMNFAAVGLRFGNVGTIGVHLRNMAFGDIERTTEFEMDGTGETFSPTFFILGASISRNMTDRISIGATTNLVYESIEQVGATGLALDAGVQYRDFLGVQGLGIGVAVRNIGTSMDYEGSGLYIDAADPSTDRGTTKVRIDAAAADMPTVVDIGATYTPVNNLTVGATYMENTYGPSMLRGMAAYDFMGYLTVRGAYNFAVTEPGEMGSSAFDQMPAFGATLNLLQVLGSDVSIDYGYMPANYFNGTHIFSLRGSF